MLPKLFKLDSKNKPRNWEISVRDMGTYSQIVILSGLLEGKKTAQTIPVLNGKNIGKANATTHYTQALAEAKAKWELQLRSGYVTDLADAKQAVLSSGIRAPMLAQKYHPTGAQKGSKTLAKMKWLGKTIAGQPKFDGNRVVPVVNPMGVRLFTRKGDPMLPIPHIEAELWAAYVMADLRTEIELDGELFTDTFSFNVLNGLLRKEDKSEEQLKQLEKIDLRLYDAMLPVGYLQRREALKPFYTDHVLETETVLFEATDENIREHFERLVAEGHEGMMLRDLETPYENKRSWSLVKYKDFEDEEFEVIDIEEDARGGFVGAFIMKMDVPSIDRDGKPIEVFRVGVSGLSQEEGREMLMNKDNYIGRQATIEFFGRSEYSVPRFGKLKAFRD
jgi:ATP-dependent DNA ligase